MSSTASGLASTLHVLEIAHTHYWLKEGEYLGGSSPSSAGHSAVLTQLLIVP